MTVCRTSVFPQSVIIGESHGRLWRKESGNKVEGGRESVGGKDLPGDGAWP